MVLLWSSPLRPYLHTFYLRNTLEQLMQFWLYWFNSLEHLYRSEYNCSTNFLHSSFIVCESKYTPYLCSLFIFMQNLGSGSNHGCAAATAGLTFIWDISSSVGFCITVQPKLFVSLPSFSQQCFNVSCVGWGSLWLCKLSLVWSRKHSAE